MRNRQYIKLIVLLAVSLLSSTLYAQIPDDVKSYAVIGAFQLEKNAARYATLHSGTLETEVRQNKFNNMFYVYVFESDDVEEARAKVYEVREKHSILTNAWLYNGNFNCLHIPSNLLNSKQAKSSGGIEELVHDVEEMELEREKEVAEKSAEKIGEVVESTMTEEAIEQPKEPKMEKKEGTYWLYFNTYDITSLDEVSGNVLVVDAERNKELSKQPSHQLIEFPDPKNGTNRITVSSDIFGYRVEKLTLDLDEPLASNSSAVTTIGDSIILDFPLKRYNKGEFMTMYNVYFYIDAAIMKEESIMELNQLLDMMRDNDALKIKIHGHTNGNSHGVVKHLDLDDKRFFSLSGSHLEDKASAKQLSLYRAHTIKYWLMDQGIAEDRMEIIGWGGKKMLYDKHSNQADKNVRVEIEILEE